jgi:hypothetical protein
MTPGQVAAAMSAGTWGAFDIGLMTDVFGIGSTETNHVYAGVAVGGLLGFGAGALYAYSSEPSEGDISVMNSLGMYGAGMGLLLGVAIDPPTGEAYSLQAVLGSTAGLAAGWFLSRYVETTRRRMLFVDVGAAAGAAVPWALLYPLIADGGTNNDEQVAGALSTATLAAGAVAAWLLTRDEGRGSTQAPAADAAPLAILRRTDAGQWSLGAPLVRPMSDPELAPPNGLALGVDVLAGQF